jgi:membrane-bound lytic murein transglycosylase F
MEHEEHDIKNKRDGNIVDLPEIIEKKKLTVLAENSSTTYFMYRGKKMGFEYELLRLFAEDLGVQLEIKMVNNLDSLTPMLNKNEGDLIACNYTITRERNKVIDFSVPFLETHQVLVQRKPGNWMKRKQKDWKKEVLTNPLQLAKKDVHVWQNSSYFQRLIHMQEEIGDTIHIQAEPGTIGGEEMIEMVSEGIIDYTITEENIAIVNSRFYDNLDVDLAVSVNQKIAFGLRKSSHLLKSRLNQWLTEFKTTPKYRYIYRKYFEKPQYTNSAFSDYSSLNGRSISKFDNYFKDAEEKTGIDWRLTSAVCYQETKFNPGLISFGGAYGIMQFMPSTGPTYGVYADSPIEIQILGGAKKIKADMERWSDIPDEIQRLKFTLASYNAGRCHIEDAQKLAKKFKLDPYKWDDNVGEMLLNLSKQRYYQDEVVRCGFTRGTNTFRYVEKVVERYEQWKQTYK